MIRIVIADDHELIRGGLAGMLGAQDDLEVVGEAGDGAAAVDLVLRERPDEWNARYNLELAQRLVPDYEVRNWRRSGSEAEVEEALKRDKSAWTEMIGTPRGMH